MDRRVIAFGPFRLHMEQRLLVESGRPVRLGSRAFDILAALVEHAGEVVGKEQLVARAWPKTFVEDANLKIQVSALRRTLGDGQDGARYIITVPGRGYNFVAPVRRETEPRAASAPAIPSTTPHNLPFAVTRTVGRDETVAALVARLSRERLVTVVGPGGIGKTTVALAVAEQMMAGYEHGVWLVDLAPLADPGLVPSAVATVLGLEGRTTDPLEGLVAAITNRQLLLVLDNCEHVIDAAAGLATAVLGGARGVSILATSREPLAVVGEGECRLAPLGVPQASLGLTAAQAATSAAVQLFVERVSAIVEDFALTDANAPVIAEICRRLDGLPLAIEFAAPRVEALGVEGLAARLDDRLKLLGARRRTTLPRQRTMRAVVDWSYGLLNNDQQRLFRALGIFPGVLTVEAAAFVALSGARASDAMDCLADLAAKSLVVADASGAEPQFRLLDTTRAFAIEKLDIAGEHERIARRHADYCLARLRRSDDAAPARRTGGGLAHEATEIDDVRAALDWAFSSAGEGSLGVSLTAASGPLWLRRSLLAECGSRTRQALQVLATVTAPDPREEMVLRTALGASLPDPPDMAAAFTRVLEIAEALQDREYQMRALRGLYYHHVTSNQFRAALALARRFRDIAGRGANRGDSLVGERMVGAVAYILGDLVEARLHLEPLLAHYAATDPGQAFVGFDDVVRFHHDGQVETCLFLSGVLWLQGYPHQALLMAERSLAVAEAIGHVTSQCLALALATGQLAFWTGDLDAAADHTRRLAELSARNGLPHWAAYGARYRRIIALKGGDVSGLEGIEGPDAFVGNLSSCTELVDALAKAGRQAEGIAALEDFEARSPELGVFASEFLRVRGELMRLQTTPDAANPSEDFFRRALDVARRHGALSLELRAATSLARQLCVQGHQREAIACLQPVYERFTEGFDTADLAAAKRLLDELRGARRPTAGRDANHQRPLTPR